MLSALIGHSQLCRIEVTILHEQLKILVRDCIVQRMRLLENNALLYFFHDCACLGLRPHSCTTCGKSFSHSAALRKHIDAIHKGKHFSLSFHSVIFELVKIAYYYAFSDCALIKFIMTAVYTGKYF